MITTLLISLSQTSHHEWVIGAHTSLTLSCSFNVVWTHYAPDNIPAINRTISCQTSYQPNLNFDILQPCHLVVESSTYDRLDAYCCSMPHTETMNISIIEWIRDQPILCQHESWHVSSYSHKSDPCTPYHPKAMRCVGSGTSQRTYSFSWVMLRPGLISCRNVGRSIPHLSQSESKNAFNRILTISCCACSSMPVLDSFQKRMWLKTLCTANAHTYQ